MYGGEPYNAQHLRLTSARIDEDVVATRRRALRMERLKALALAALMMLVTLAIMSLVGWIGAKFSMGY